MPPMTMSSTLLRSCRLLGPALLIGSMATIIAPRAHAQWTVINLHPAGVSYVFDSYANGFQGGGGQVVGYIRTVGTFQNHAAVWNGNAQSFVDLHPADASMSSAVSVANGKQVGNAWINGTPRASLWSGSAASWVDLTPAGSGSGFAAGASGTQQVGQAAVGANVHAGRWSGTAGSWVDLNPASATSSIAIDTDGTQQVGYAYTNNSEGNTRASLWTGTANSWVNLHPNAALGSRALAVHGGQQVGWGIYPITMRAHLWTGTANSLVNLHPAGTGQSRCNGVHAGQQVGMVSVIVGTSAIEHAALWSGTAASWVDLHTFLPANFLFSEAYDIWHAPAGGPAGGSITWIVGTGYNTATQRYEAIMWRNGPPCAGDINNDAAVNVNDLLGVISAWGPCPPSEPPAPPLPCAADTNADNQVDVNDLLAVITTWGSC